MEPVYCVFVLGIIGLMSCYMRNVLSLEILKTKHTVTKFAFCDVVNEMSLATSPQYTPVMECKYANVRDW